MWLLPDRSSLVYLFIGATLSATSVGITARVPKDATLAELLHPLASLFVPLFFVLMGLQVQLGRLASPAVFGFGGLLIVCALVGKLACALGVLGHGINRPAVAAG
jgi:Kef-type K+ transport system membrane component KefB